MLVKEIVPILNWPAVRKFPGFVAPKKGKRAREAKGRDRARGWMNSKREKGGNVESRRQISGVRRVEAYYRVRVKGMAYRDKEREKSEKAFRETE